MNYLTTDTDLTSIANAIRAKGGTSASLAFPAGFVSAVEAISGGGETPEVPTGYTQLAYIETDGQSLIDTGIIWGANKRIEYSWAQDGSVTRARYSHPLGANNCFVQMTLTNFISNANVKINDSSYTGSIYFPSTPNTLIVTPNLITAKGYGVDSPAGQIMSQTGSMTTTGSTIALGARHTANSGYDGVMAGTMIFRYKMYDNDVLIQDLVPAKRDADNEIGLYDIVTNSFLVNAGSGSFTGGAM